jgi:DNA-binding SARP family transcriptional activator
MAADLRIWLLGGFRAELDGRDVAAGSWRRNRARALVKLLALSPGRRLHREPVIDALWPDLDAAAGSANLRRALHFARGALRPEALTVHDLSLTHLTLPTILRV